MADDWLDYQLTGDEIEETLLRARDAEMTRMHPGPAFLLGALLAVALVLVLLLATI